MNEDFSACAGNPLEQVFSVVLVQARRDKVHVRVTTSRARSRDEELKCLDKLPSPLSPHFRSLATFAFVSSASAPARAFGTHHPFRLTGDEWPGLSNCRFDAYAQCRAAASGRADLHHESVFRRTERRPLRLSESSRAQPPGVTSAQTFRLRVRHPTIVPILLLLALLSTSGALHAAAARPRNRAFLLVGLARNVFNPRRADCEPWRPGLRSRRAWKADACRHRACRCERSRCAYSRW